MNKKYIQNPSKKQEKTRELIDYSRLLTPSEQSVLGHAIKLAITHPVNFQSQAHVADKIGRCTKTVARAQKRLERDGIFTITRRGWGGKYKGWLTNIIHLNPLLKDKEIIKALAFHLPFSCLGIAFLFSLRTLQTENVLRNKIKYINTGSLIYKNSKNIEESDASGLLRSLIRPPSASFSQKSDKSRTFSGFKGIGEILNGMNTTQLRPAAAQKPRKRAPLAPKNDILEGKEERIKENANMFMDILNGKDE